MLTYTILICGLWIMINQIVSCFCIYIKCSQMGLLLIWPPPTPLESLDYVVNIANGIWVTIRHVHMAHVTLQAKDIICLGWLLFSVENIVQHTLHCKIWQLTRVHVLFPRIYEWVHSSMMKYYTIFLWLGCKLKTFNLASTATVLPLKIRFSYSITNGWLHINGKQRPKPLICMWPIIILLIPVPHM